MHSATTAVCLLVALAAGGEIASAQDHALGQYSVDAKLVTLPDEQAQDMPAGGAISSNDVAAVAGRAQVETIDFPKVMADVEKTATVALTSEMTLPDGTTRKIGPTLDVRALKDGQRFKVEYHSVNFLGYRDPQAKLPHFRNRTVIRNIASTTPAEPVYTLIEVTSYSDAPALYGSDGRILASQADAHKRQLLFVKITRG